MCDTESVFSGIVLEDRNATIFPRRFALKSAYPPDWTSRVARAAAKAAGLSWMGTIKKVTRLRVANSEDYLVTFHNNKILLEISYDLRSREFNFSMTLEPPIGDTGNRRADEEIQEIYEDWFHEVGGYRRYKVNHKSVRPFDEWDQDFDRVLKIAFERLFLVNQAIVRHFNRDRSDVLFDVLQRYSR